MEKYRAIAETEYADGCKLERRLAESGEKMEVYDDDTLLVGHLLDFVRDNMDLYAEYIKRETECNYGK